MYIYIYIYIHTYISLHPPPPSPPLFRQKSFHVYTSGAWPWTASSTAMPHLPVLATTSKAERARASDGCQRVVGNTPGTWKLRHTQTFVLDHKCESGGLASAKCTLLWSLWSICENHKWITNVKVVVWLQPNAHLCDFVVKPSLAFIILKAWLNSGTITSGWGYGFSIIARPCL